jgi:hypothetical protein
MSAFGRDTTLALAEIQFPLLTHSGLCFQVQPGKYCAFRKGSLTKAIIGNKCCTEKEKAPAIPGLFDLMIAGAEAG